MTLNNYIQENLDKLNWHALSANPKPLFIKWHQNIYKIIFDYIFNENKINKGFDATL